MVNPGWDSSQPGLSWCFAKYSAKGPVSRILSCAVIPLDAALPRTFISDLPGGFGNSSSRLSTPGRHGVRAWLLAPALPPYLVLLRVGFTLPPALLPARCALTAPFHPYSCGGQPFGLASRQGRYVLCGTSRPRTLKPASRTLSGTLPCGVRTFLSRRTVLAHSFRQRPPGPPARV